ncbi:hypothetical protein T439DRAFT_356294 [Meredithblackwellia eburnea MCA 4105]
MSRYGDSRQSDLSSQEDHHWYNQIFNFQHGPKADEIKKHTHDMIREFLPKHDPNDKEGLHFHFGGDKQPVDTSNGFHAPSLNIGVHRLGRQREFTATLTNRQLQRLGEQRRNEKARTMGRYSSSRNQVGGGALDVVPDDLMRQINQHLLVGASKGDKGAAVGFMGLSAADRRHNRLARQALTAALQTGRGSQFQGPDLLDQGLFRMTTGSKAPQRRLISIPSGSLLSTSMASVAQTTTAALLSMTAVSSTQTKSAGMFFLSRNSTSESTESVTRGSFGLSSPIVKLSVFRTKPTRTAGLEGEEGSNIQIRDRPGTLE